MQTRPQDYEKRPNKSPVIFHGWDGGIRSRFATPPHRGSEHSSLRMTSLRSKDFCSAPPHATRKFELPTLSHAKSPRKRELLAWLGWRDSNPRMHGPKPCALPLGDTPMLIDCEMYFAMSVQVGFGHGHNLIYSCFALKQPCTLPLGDTPMLIDCEMYFAINYRSVVLAL